MKSYVIINFATVQCNIKTRAAMYIIATLYLDCNFKSKHAMLHCCIVATCNVTLPPWYQCCKCKYQGFNSVLILFTR